MCGVFGRLILGISEAILGMNSTCARDAELMAKGAAGE